MPPGRRSSYARAHPPWSGPCGGAQSLQVVMLCVVLGVIVLSGVVSAQSAHDESSSFSSTNAVHYPPPEPSLLSNATVTGEVLLRPVLRSPSSTDSERSDLLPADDMADVVNVVFKGEKGVVDGLKDWLDSKTSLSIVMGICGGIIAVSIALFILCFCLRDREDLPFSLPFIGEGDDGGGGGGGGGGKMKVISGAAPKAGTCKLTMIACDIENSWMLWNMRPETFEEIEADYKREMRNSLIMHNCFEFRQVGTMFLITSNSPLSALQWATAMQQYFPSDTAQTPHVRMGIHLAECKVKIDKKTGDYEIQGPLTDIAQRTMLEAQPGHAWVTEATHDALGEGDLEVIDLQAIGERDLPGLRKSISMYQLLCGPGAREYDPPEPTSPEVVSPEESEEPASPQPGGGRPKALDVHKLNNEDTPNFEDSIYGGKATEALQTKKSPPPTAPTEPAERPRKAPPKIERKMKVRGEVGDPAVVRWKNAAGEVDPVRFIHGTPSISGDKIQRCFAEGNGLLFRINDTVNGKWAFYNDTLNFNMRVGMTCSKNSEFVALGSAKFTEDPVSGQYIGELIIPPLKTEPLLAGTVGRYKLMYSAAPSQGFDPSKIRNPLDGDEEQKHSAR